MKTTSKTTIEIEHFKTFNKIKSKYPDAIVLLRIEDDYITFEQDAEVIHRITGKKLINHPVMGNNCRFAFPQLDIILNKLARTGNRVAVCDQLESPKR